MNKKIKINDKKSAKMYIILFLVIVLQILFVLRYCNIKSGYFVDEIWSYGLANSYYHAQIWEDGALDTVKIDPEMFRDYLTVNEGEEFSYGSVFYNQTHDSHPPLFYLVLHIISSFFPGEFSKWFGLVPNILYCVLTLIYVYKIACLFTNKKWFPFVPVIWFGFSLAAVNMVTYIRMYMMLTMWSTMFAYFHLKITKRQKAELKDYIFLVVTVFGGLFTHFYFVIFAFPWVVVMLIGYVISKKWKDVVKYIISGLTGIVCVCIVYPEILRNVLGGNSGHSSNMYVYLRNFGDWKIRIQTYRDIISTQMFGSVINVIIAILIMIFFAYYVTQVVYSVRINKNSNGFSIDICRIKEGKRWHFNIEERHNMFIMMFFSTLFYFLIVSKITPWLSDRYMFCIFPLCIVIFTLVICFALKIWKISCKWSGFIAYICVIVVFLLTYFAGNPEYLYEDKANNVSISREYSSVPCVYIYDNSYLMVNNSLELMNYNDLYHMQHEEVVEKIEEVDYSGGELVVYLDKVMNDNLYTDKMTLKECLKEIQERTELKNKKKLFEDDKVCVYYLKK